MKGFIEVVYSNGNIILLNVNKIIKVKDNIIYMECKSYYKVEQDYNQIKELIKQAQHD